MHSLIEIFFFLHIYGFSLNRLFFSSILFNFKEESIELNDIFFFYFFLSFTICSNWIRIASYRTYIYIYIFNIYANELWISTLTDIGSSNICRERRCFSIYCWRRNQTTDEDWHVSCGVFLFIFPSFSIRKIERNVFTKCWLYINEKEREREKTPRKRNIRKCNFSIDFEWVKNDWTYIP